jgi:CheY-like chemotaxis protein
MNDWTMMLPKRNLNCSHWGPILLADDDADFRMVIRDILSAEKPCGELGEVGNGFEVMEFLRRRGPFESAPAAALVYLDMNMPGLSGLQVLQRIKLDVGLRHIPVVILSGQDDPWAAHQAQCCGSAGYLVKPREIGSLRRVIRATTEYWMASALASQRWAG